ncbi:F-ATPase, F1 complex, subunit delta AtpH [Gottschalkia acidurici 9a]|uniref:ATP synthase subunit delta n=1 Tax=Gottschalkia acidurici (strain ATCC 7906 / DSM 604 / BCRC 14475 / CIP 104303 / KCTC 5404 / NCIMB 10678 / 9a) TaxID=1128398 RepID=K0AWX7_GOTA9|nr:F-ATPase, F1 complex, subunit delta AtpH [Gottschalkia acidurici 9a]
MFKEKVSGEILNLCYIAIDKRREKYLGIISKEYKELSNKQQGIVEAIATTAITMSEEEIAQLQEKLSKQLNKKVVLTNTIDSSIVGGVLVKVGDKIIDGSIKGKLDDIYRSLNNMKLTRE